MKFAAGLPIVAMSDPIAIRDFAQALDGAEFDVISTAGHVLAAPAGRFPDRPTPTYAGPFHDPFVLFGYLAGMTRRLHFRSGVLILPLLPTALVAKQAAELQLLSGSRFELGVGISWNTLEYEALNQDFRARGKRMEEQIAVLRRLWTEPYVNFEGRWHKLDGVGLNRLPTSPIPIWIGSGNDDVVLRRVARLADGWFPISDPTEAVPKLKEYARAAGRDADSIGFTGRVMAGPGGPAAWVESAKKAQALGATHLALGTPPDVQGEAVLKRLLEARQVLGAELSA
ncbi:MAG TPA: TIGR03619 family F420-dependent LLM class oxidoreductase [Chloroflexota bacterium]|nr:TIGR03619 family F420-dependent LLM class oxidoreductase [Chloroflexota bacterium]